MHMGASPGHAPKVFPHPNSLVRQPVIATGLRVCYHQPVGSRTAQPWPEAPMSEPAKSFLTRPESQGQPIAPAE